MFSKKLGSFSMFWRMSAQMFIWISFLFRSEESWYHLETQFFSLKLLRKICRTVSLSMLINSVTARMLRRWFCRTISLNLSMLASVFYVLGWLGRWLTPISSLPSLNFLTFRRRIKPRLPFAGIISRLIYSTRFQDKG